MKRYFSSNKDILTLFVNFEVIKPEVNTTISKIGMSDAVKL